MASQRMSAGGTQEGLSPFRAVGRSPPRMLLSLWQLFYPLFPQTPAHPKPPTATATLPLIHPTKWRSALVCVSMEIARPGGAGGSRGVLPRGAGGC